MNIDRATAIRILDKIAAELANKYGYDQISHKDASFGVWDMKNFGPFKIEGVEAGSMSAILKAKYGKMVEYRYFAKGHEKDYVEFRYRFESPCVSIHEHGNRYLAELEITDLLAIDDDGEYVKDDNDRCVLSGNYGVSELLCFGPKGIEWGNMLYAMWNEKVQKLCGDDIN